MVAGSSGSGSVSTAAVSQAIAQATAQAIASAVANATGGNSAATAAASASSLQTDIQTALSSAAGQASFTGAACLPIGACTWKWNLLQPKQPLIRTSPIAPKAGPDGDFASSDIPESFSPRFVCMQVLARLRRIPRRSRPQWHRPSQTLSFPLLRLFQVLVPCSAYMMIIVIIVIIVCRTSACQHASVTD